MRASRTGRWCACLGVAASTLALFAPASSGAAPLGHVVAGSGVDGVGNRLSVVAYDDFLLGGTGSAVVRLASSPGPAATVIFTCTVVQFTPSHMLFASGPGTDGRTYFIGVFDDTRPLGRGPYDAISTRTFAGSGPCGVAAPYPTGWFPVSTGDYVIGP